MYYVGNATYLSYSQTKAKFRRHKRYKFHRYTRNIKANFLEVHQGEL